MTIANLETIIDMQSWCRTWLPNGSRRIRAKHKLHRKPREACKSSWSPIGSLKSFILTILGYALYAGRIWKGDVLVADIEELETMDASEIYSKRLNAKEVIFPQEKGEFIFQSQMDESNPLEEIKT